MTPTTSTQKKARRIHFTWADAWILYAVIISRPGNGASLQSIISAADGINHAIPTYQELRGAMVRLQRVGCIVEKDHRYRATAMVISAHKRTTTPRRTMLKAVEDAKVFLDNLDFRRVTATSSIPTIPTKAHYRDAVEQYKREDQIMMRELIAKWDKWKA